MKDDEFNNPTFPTLTEQDVDDLNELYGHWNAYEPLGVEIEKQQPQLAEAFKEHDREAKRASRRVPKRKKVIGYVYDDGSTQINGRRSL